MAKEATKKSKAAVNDSNKVKKTAKKAQKDPNAPKRSLTAYLYFANAKRDEVKEANAEMSFGERNKLMGSMWREMSAEDKKPYEESAQKDKERYEREKAEYQANGGAAASATKSKAKAKPAPKKESESEAEAKSESEDEDSE